MRRRLGRIIAGVLGAVCIASIAQPAGADTAALPVPYTSLAAVKYALEHPDAPPPGANDWNCRPSAEHPRPVILVPGTQANMTIDWTTISPLLANHGFCVFTFNFGVQQVIRLGGFSFTIGGTSDIRDSAAELSAFVDKVRAATGADKVDLVGHSQGGSMPRYYISYLGGNRYVNTLIGLEPSNHGTDYNGILSDWFLGRPLRQLGDDPRAKAIIDGLGLRSSFQQIQGSEYNHELNDRAPNHGVDPNVRYVVLGSITDTTVTPTTSMFLAGPNVTNILMQQKCLFFLSDHTSPLFSRYSTGIILHELDPSVPFPSCSPALPYLGG